MEEIKKENKLKYQKLSYDIKDIDISGNDLYSSGMALGRLQIRKYKEP